MESLPNKVDQVRTLVSTGHGDELRLMLLGASKYCQALNDARNITYPESYAQGKGGFHAMTWVHAHLEFTSMFGELTEQANRDGRSYFAHRTEYEQWLQDDAPGLFREELEALYRNIFQEQ